jgi:electron transport complex protein RnfG
LASGVLAAVNAFTEPYISAQKQKNEKAALKEVVPQAAEFEPRTQDGKLLYYVAHDAAKNLQGFVLKVTKHGYSSDIETMAGLTPDLQITAIKILYQNETPGLGTRVAEKDFCGQFTGKRLADFSRVQAITGATISSSAVIKAVQEGIASLEPQLRTER